MELKAKKPKATEETKKTVVEIRRSISDKSSLSEPKKKRDDDVSKAAAQYNRFLVIINVYGSTGPIKFLVNGDSSVREMIEKTLKIYASEGRLPAIGSAAAADNFSLSPAENGSEDRALKLEETIGSCGARRFVLCRRRTEPAPPQVTAQRMDMRKGNKWRAWLQKSLSFNVLSV